MREILCRFVCENHLRYFDFLTTTLHNGLLDNITQFAYYRPPLLKTPDIFEGAASLQGGIEGNKAERKGD